MKFSVKKSKKFVLKFVLLSIVIYVVFLFINQQVKINNKREELTRINKQICNEKCKNEETRNKINEHSDDKKPGEDKRGKRVFENSAE